MAVVYRDDEGSNLIEIELDGSIERADFERVAERLEAAIQRHGKLRLLEVAHNFPGMDVGTLVEDLKFSLRHLNDFSRVAVVTDHGWLRRLATVSKALVRAELRVFDLAEIEAARAWLRQP